MGHGGGQGRRDDQRLWKGTLKGRGREHRGEAGGSQEGKEKRC